MESIKDWTSLTRWSLETFWPAKAPSEQVLPALRLLYTTLKSILDTFTALKDLRPWCDGLLVTLESMDHATGVQLQTILDRWPSTTMSAIPFLSSTKLVQLEAILSSCIMHAQISLDLNQQIAVMSGQLPSISTEKQQPEATFTFSTFATAEKITPTVDADQSQSASSLLGLLGNDSATSESEINGVEDNCCYIYQKVRRERCNICFCCQLNLKYCSKYACNCDDCKNK